MPKYEVTWTEITTYRRVFELSEPVDLDNYADVHEALDNESAWDQANFGFTLANAERVVAEERHDEVSDLVEVSERNIDNVVDTGE